MQVQVLYPLGFNFDEREVHIEVSIGDDSLI